MNRGLTRRVADTGIGAVTPIGVGVQKFWEGLKAGKNGIARVTHFNPSGFSSTMAAVVKDFRPTD